MSCDVKNRIYGVLCCSCQEEYTGETGDILRHRATVYSRQIRDTSTRMLSVSGHIDDCVRNLRVQFQILPSYNKSNTVFLQEK